MVRRRLAWILAAVIALLAVTAPFYPGVLWLLVVVVPAAALGAHDVLQREHTLLRNFPIVGRIRYLMEKFRPQIQQYFIESNIDAYPVEREFREIVYQRSKGELETRPLGTQRNTMKGFLELLGAMGLDHPGELSPEHVFRRVDDLRVRNLRELYEYLEPGQLLDDVRLPEGLRDEWRQARPDGWTLAAEHGQYGGPSLRTESPVSA